MKRIIALLVLLSFIVPSLTAVSARINCPSGTAQEIELEEDAEHERKVERIILGTVIGIALFLIFFFLPFFW